MPVGNNRLFIAAHPDDTETMLGYLLAETPGQAWVLVATDGEASTINMTNEPDFVRSGKRRQESEAGLICCGVSRGQQLYPNLPDGGVTEHIAELTRIITDLTITHQFQEIITLGEQGYDGHPDHIATHLAAVAACKVLKDQQLPVSVLALDADQQGSRLVRGDPHYKLRAMACHHSQFAIFDANKSTGPSVEIAGYALGAVWWQSFSVYHPLLQVETYSSVIL